MRKILSGLALLVAVSSIAYALTAPPTVDTRRVPWQTTTHYRFTVNATDGGITNGVKVGAVPAGAFIDTIKCYVWIAFTGLPGGGFLNLGTLQAEVTSGGGMWVTGSAATTAACQAATTGIQNLTTANGLGMSVTSGLTPTGTSGGWDIWFRYGTTVTPTTGKVTFVFTYVPDDDM